MQAIRSIRGLLVAQFFGAFNDNAWKYLVVLLPMAGLGAAAGDGGGPEDAGGHAVYQQWATIAFVVFTLPLMVFSLPAAFWADRISKRSIIVGLKGVEVLLMAAGTIVLAREMGSWALLGVLGFMGVQSALFSPAKYGILAEILPHEKLSKGNGLLEMWTFLAIILGTVAGTFLLDHTGGREWVAGAVLTALAGGGWLASRRIPLVAPAGNKERFAVTLRESWSALCGERVLWLTVLGMTFFWTIASLLGQDVLVYVKESLQATHTESSLPLAVFAIGVGAGSIWAGRLSGDKVEYGLIPMGALGLSLVTLLLGIFAPGVVGLLIFMVPLGIASGFVLVPLNALLQWRAPENRRGAVIALSNVFVFAGCLAGSLGAYGLSLLDVSPRGIFVAAGVVTAAGTVWAMKLLPQALLRFALVVLTHTFYRLRILGIEHVPEKGGALLVPNHVSFVDGLFILTSIDRPVRFVMDSGYFNHPLFRPFLKPLRAIPISPSEGPRSVLRAMREAGKALDEGDLVCVFAEGQITRTGALLPFRRGMERIIKGRSTPVIPVNLDRLWGSIFSAEGGSFVWKLPKRIPYWATVSFGEPLPPETPVHKVRRAVNELGERAWQLRKPNRRPLHHSFIRAVRRRPFAFACADFSGRKLSQLRALGGAVALARALRPHWRGQRNVGILLPPSIGGFLANLAAAFSGRTTVNFNYTVGPDMLESIAQQSGVTTIVTHREFLEKAKVELPPGVKAIWLEDLVPQIGAGGKLLSALVGFFLPARWVEKLCGAEVNPTVDDIATIIFSSGSTGAPKGVLLSHFNIDSNVEGVNQMLPTTRTDRILGILPLFHAFGYTALWFSANHTVGVVFHPNPLDAAAVGDVVHKCRATIMIATPTFLQLYLRRCEPGQFGSLRLVIAGAEKLSERLRLAFEDCFGIRPLEGYGTTECSPVVAISTPAFRAPGFYQPGWRRGFVGQPLPGVAVRVVDPDTFEVLEPNKPGMLLVKGPNVMQGYLDRDDLTAEVMKDGWYVTGDIALLDEDGFVKITDRLSRFSKIGGEMVPHGRVEEGLQEAANLDVHSFAVTGVADEKKGEKLVVLHTVKEDDIPGILEKLAESGLPNLFIPKRENCVRVDALPLLGSGKLDLKRIKQMAEERFAAPAEKAGRR